MTNTYVYKLLDINFHLGNEPLFGAVFKSLSYNDYFVYFYIFLVSNPKESYFMHFLRMHAYIVKKLLSCRFFIYSIDLVDVREESIYSIFVNVCLSDHLVCCASLLWMFSTMFWMKFPDLDELPLSVFFCCIFSRMLSCLY